MRKERILKIIVALIMGVVLFAMTTNVFAAVDADTGLDFYEDTTDELDRNTNTNTNTNTNINTNINTNTNTNNVTLNTNTNNYNTNLPKAGLAENTMAGVAITVLGITAVYAYKKIKEYKNI